MKINILVIGDIVGEPGRQILKKKLPELIRTKEIAFCVGNAENAAGGAGITPDVAEELLASQIDVLTSGDHIWKHKEIVPYLDRYQRVLRPANYPAEAPGKGFGVYETNHGFAIGVINLLGRTFMPPTNCPFHTVDQILQSISDQTKIILVDLHAEATSEKVAMGWYLDGRVSLVFGTHTHIQTADERILPKGTAYITDIGMTGPYESVLGRKTERVLSAFTTGMPAHFDVAKKDVRISGLLVSLDTTTGRAFAIERVMIYDT